MKVAAAVLLVLGLAVAVRFDPPLSMSRTDCGVLLSSQFVGRVGVAHAPYDGAHVQRRRIDQVQRISVVSVVHFVHRVGIDDRGCDIHMTVTLRDACA